MIIDFKRKLYFHETGLHSWRHIRVRDITDTGNSKKFYWKKDKGFSSAWICFFSPMILATQEAEARGSLAKFREILSQK